MITYFNAMGLFIHLCGSDVEHRQESNCFIFTSPTYLSENVSKLFQVQFLEDHQCEGGLLMLKNKGILTKTSLKDIHVDDTHLAHKDFMDLLLDLFIGGEIKADSGDKKLFIPSVLTQSSGGRSRACHLELQGSQPQFVISFDSLGFIPFVVFTGAVIHLLSKVDWNICTVSISRIHIQFAVGARGSVHLFDGATHIRVVMADVDEQKEQDYRNTILDAIAESYCFLYHGKTGRKHQSAPCEKCHCRPFLVLGLICHVCTSAAIHIARLFLDNSDPATVRCQGRPESRDLSVRQKLLFWNMKHYVSVAF